MFPSHDQHDTEGTAYSIEQHEEFMRVIQDGDAMKYHLLRHRIPEQTWIALHNSFEKGQKSSNKEKARQLEKEGYEIFSDYKQKLVDAAESNDETAVQELLNELEQDELDFLMGALADGPRQFVNNVKEAA